MVLSKFNEELAEYTKELKKSDEKKANNLSKLFNHDYAEKLIRFYIDRCKFRQVFAFIQFRK